MTKRLEPEYPYQLPSSKPEKLRRAAVALLDYASVLAANGDREVSFTVQDYAKWVQDAAAELAGRHRTRGNRIAAGDFARWARALRADVFDDEEYEDWSSDLPTRGDIIEALEQAAETETRLHGAVQSKRPRESEGSTK